MGSISPFKGVRERRDKRRDKRRDNRKLRKSGPAKQFYGGSEESLDDARKRAGERVDSSQEGYNAANDRLTDVGDKLDTLSSKAGTDYSNAKTNYNQARAGANTAIGGITTAAGTANDMRTAAYGSSPTLSQSADSILSRRAAALAGSPTIGQATDTAIKANDANATARLSNTIGQNNRAAIGMAAGAGESGALGIQQAIATGAQGGADAMSESNLQQNELAAQLRFEAAQAQRQQDIDTANVGAQLRTGAVGQDRADLLSIGDKNAANTYDAANQTATQRQAFLAANQGAVDSANQRQLTLTGQQTGTAQAGAAAALTNSAANLNNEQFVNGTQLGVDMTAAQNAYNAAKENNPWQKFVSTVFDPGDLRGSGSKGLAG